MRDLWFDAMEDRLNELEAEGVPFAEAYRRASEDAEGIVMERLSSLADYQRMRAKEGL